MFAPIQDFFRWLGGRWCHVTHPDPMWPIKGRYRCMKCHRTYPVPWSGTEGRPAAAKAEPTGVPTRNALVDHPMTPFRLGQG